VGLGGGGRICWSSFGKSEKGHLLVPRPPFLEVCIIVWGYESGFGVGREAGRPVLGGGGRSIELRGRWQSAGAEVFL